MKTTILGRTGLNVTVAGLGAGGHSRLGIDKYGIEHAVNIVRTACDNGVNFFDTATVYGTEEAVGLGLNGITRDKYVLSTKFPYRDRGGIQTPEKLEQTLEQSLRLLRTDCIDVYNLHGVSQEDYAETVERLMPAMQKSQQQGKVRYLGVTEAFGHDTSHAMLRQALNDDIFDVIMVGYNIINPSAAKVILPTAAERNIGVQCMFAVRSALSNPEQLKIDVRRILEHKQADPTLIPLEGTLDFLTENGVAGSIMEAAYRFCSNAAGIHVTLTGTGSIEHLLDNINSIQRNALPDDVLAKLHDMFGEVDCVNGQ